MEIPEKIYLHPNIGDKEFIKPWLPKPFNQNSVEYTNTEAFMKKATEWLKTNTLEYKDDDWDYGGASFALEEFIEDFVTAMKS